MNGPSASPGVRPRGAGTAAYAATASRITHDLDRPAARAMRPIAASVSRSRRTLVGTASPFCSTHCTTSLESPAPRPSATQQSGLFRSRGPEVAGTRQADHVVREGMFESTSSSSPTRPRAVVAGATAQRVRPEYRGGQIRSQPRTYAGEHGSKRSRKRGRRGSSRLALWPFRLDPATERQVRLPFRNPPDIAPVLNGRRREQIDSSGQVLGTSRGEREKTALETVDRLHADDAAHRIDRDEPDPHHSRLSVRYCRYVLDDRSLRPSRSARR